MGGSCLPRARQMVIKLSQDRDKTVQLWDAQTGELQLMLEGHTSGITSVRKNTPLPTSFLRLQKKYNHTFKTQSVALSLFFCIMLVTNKMLNDRREVNCLAVSADRKYYRDGQTFVKRSLRPTEWQLSPLKGIVHVPRQGRERILNEAAAMRYIADNTNIPIPKLHCAFEDDGAVYLIMEYVEGSTMDELGVEQRTIVQQELDGHIKTLHALKSRKVGGPSGLVVPPYRVTRNSPRETWQLKESGVDEYVFCHNDLSQQNIIVDPVTLQIRAIIDWEYAGFYPEYFDLPFFKRLGQSVALDAELDDSEKLLSFLNSNLVSTRTF